MSRPKKHRKICSLPEHDNFGPIDCKSEEYVILKLDEYEAIRLIDYEDLTQVQCSEKMKIARTTVQGIYKRGRFKIADALINGKRLIIEGGCYKLCNKSSKPCNKECIKKLDKN